MNASDFVLLKDMLLYLKRAQNRVANRVYDDMFLEDNLMGDALVRSLEVVGEAANHVSTIFQTEHPEIDWINIINLRHRLIHGYTEINWNTVWSVATVDSPLLIEKLTHILAEET